VVDLREDMRNNPYIQEAVRVLPVKGYRSAIGAFWNACSLLTSIGFGVS